MLRVVVLGLLLISISSCVPWSEWHDGAMAVSKNWRQQEMADLGANISFLIGLKLKNTESFTNLLMDVSDPKSRNYGKYYDQHQVYDLTSPSKSDVNAVVNWVQRYKGKTQVQNNGGFVRVNMRVADAILLFSESETEAILMYEYEHEVTGERIIRTPMQLHVPAAIADKIQLFSEINDFPHKNAKKKDTHVEAATISLDVLMGNNAIQVSFQVNTTTYSTLNLTVSQGNYLVNEVISIPTTPHLYSSFVNFYNLIDYQPVTVVGTGAFRNGTGITSITYGSAVFPSPWITPDVVNRLYSIPSGTVSTNVNNSQSVAEFDKQYYSPSDLSTFEYLMGLPASNVTVQGPNNSSFPGGESTLDIQWITAIGRNVPTTFWSVSEGFLLVWVIQISEATYPPFVHSISYGEPEQDMLHSHTDRLNQEFQLLGIRGITIISTSGDIGVSDGTDVCDKDVPDFPSSSPWTTSLGATYLYPSSQSPICSSSALGLPILCSFASELPCAADTGAGFTTGGGFSGRYLRPAYQNTAVQNYLNTATLPPSSYFNASNRGFNDVAAFGSSILINIRGEISVTGGTSASGPIFAAVIALLNDVQLNQFKPTLGFANPWLYQVASEQPGAFNQILSGDNKCKELSANGVASCCQDGFTAQSGWNPLTGLGTPVYSVLKENLP